jgi:DNA-binding IclR family transcriptional regulator
MEAALDSARRTGVAYDREEAYPGLGCVASPIRGGGRAIGAVSVTGPIARMQAHSLEHEVRNTALAIWSGQVVNRRAS